MTSRKLGSAGPHVSSLALGCMSMSGVYGPADEAESIAAIHAAMDAGIISRCRKAPPRGRRMCAPHRPR